MPPVTYEAPTARAKNFGCKLPVFAPKVLAEKSNLRYNNGPVVGYSEKRLFFAEQYAEFAHLYW